MNGFIKLSKSHCISFSTIDHLELISVLHNRSYRSYMSNEIRENYFVMPQRLRQSQQIQKEVSYVSDKSKVERNTIAKNWEKNQNTVIHPQKVLHTNNPNEPILQPLLFSRVLSVSSSHTSRTTTSIGRVLSELNVLL